MLELQLPQLFDEAFYLAQAARANGAAADPLRHYCEQGWRLGFDPHPLFNTQHYLSIRPDVARAGVNPLLHYLQFGFAERDAAPHILFDPEFYLAQLDPEERSANPIPLLHFLTEGCERGLDPHPLFCVEFYYRSRPDVQEEGVNALLHYLRDGYREHTDPHPLFDVGYYWDGFPDEPHDQDALVHFISGGHRDRSCHPLFSRQHYLAELKAHREAAPGDEPLVLHYLREGWRKGLEPHPLFKTRFYLTNYPQVRDQRLDPLSHYLEYGAREGRHPHPFFDTHYYQACYPDLSAKNLNPLKHYVMYSAQYKKYDPCWGIRTKNYLQRHPQVDNRSTFVPAHLYDNLFAPLDAALNREAALTEIAGEEFQAVHAALNAAHGVQQGCLPTRAILTSHEASRTGAPLIILKAATVLAEQYGIECFVFLERGGELEDDFAKVAHVINCERWRRETHLDNLALLVQAINRPGRTFALANSAETYRLMRLLASLEIPVFSLVHEFPTLYGFDPHIFSSVLESSKRVIFPSQLVKADCLTAMQEYAPALAAETIVLPTGLLQEDLLQERRARCRQAVAAELELEDDVFVVLGSGTVDARKGCDFFVAAARLFRARSQRKAVFVWLGSAPDWDQNDAAGYRKWIKRDIYAAGLEGVVRFVDARKDPKPFFHAADALLLLSRADPFPCVVLEALAAETPVVLFDTVNGAAEAVREDAGFVVPFMDVAAAVEKLELLYDDPALARRMGVIGRQRAATEYSFDAYMQQILEFVVGDLGWPQAGSFVRAPAPSPAEAPKPFKVFAMVPDWGLSGVNATVEVLVEGLRQRGWDAEVLLSKPWALNDGFEPRCPYRLLDHCGQRSTQEAWDAYLRLLSEHAPCAVVLTYDLDLNAASAAVPETVGLISALHCDQPEYYETAQNIGRFCNRVLCVSRRIADSCERLNPGLRERLAVVPHATMSAAQMAACTRQPRNGEPLRLIYTGRLVRGQKCAHQFLEIVDELEARQVDYRFTLIGDDAWSGVAAELEREWRPLIAAGKIRLVRRLPPQQVLHELVRHDVFLLISEYEGLPIALVEAMACGCVPITTDIKSGIPELIEHAANGFIVRDRNWRQLVDYVVQLQRDEALLERMSQQARQGVVDAHTTEAMVAGYDRLLSEVKTEVLSGAFTRPRPQIWNPLLGDVVLLQHELADLLRNTKRGVVRDGRKFFR